MHPSYSIPNVSDVIFPLPGDYISTMYAYMFSLILLEAIIISHLITDALNVLISDYCCYFHEDLTKHRNGDAS